MPDEQRVAYKALIEVVVCTGNEAEACDGMSELFRDVTEKHNAEGWVVDWRYVLSDPARMDQFKQPDPWKPVNIAMPGEYEEGQVFESEEQHAPDLVKLLNEAGDWIANHCEDPSPFAAKIHETASLIEAGWTLDVLGASKKLPLSPLFCTSAVKAWGWVRQWAMQALEAKKLDDNELTGLANLASQQAIMAIEHIHAPKTKLALASKPSKPAPAANSFPQAVLALVGSLDDGLKAYGPYPGISEAFAAHPCHQINVMPLHSPQPASEPEDYPKDQKAVPTVTALPVVKPSTAKRYVIAENWEHLGTEDNPYLIGWVYDRKELELVYVRYRGSANKPWLEMRNRTTRYWRDVHNHITVANAEAIDRPADYGLIESDELPAWAKGAT